MNRLTLTEAASASGRSRHTLKAWCQRGLVRGAMKIGNMWTLPHNWTAPIIKRGPRYLKDREDMK